MVEARSSQKQPSFIIDGYAVDKSLGDPEKNAQGLVYLVHDKDNNFYALKVYK